MLTARGPSDPAGGLRPGLRVRAGHGRDRGAGMPRDARRRGPARGRPRAQGPRGGAGVRAPGRGRGARAGGRERGSAVGRGGGGGRDGPGARASGGAGGGHRARALLALDAGQRALRRSGAGAAGHRSGDRGHLRLAPAAGGGAVPSLRPAGRRGGGSGGPRAVVAAGLVVGTGARAGVGCRRSRGPLVLGARRRVRSRGLLRGVRDRCRGGCVGRPRASQDVLTLIGTGRGPASGAGHPAEAQREPRSRRPAPTGRARSTRASSTPMTHRCCGALADDDEPK